MVGGWLWGAREEWHALAAPVEAMAFDFYEAAEDMAPAEVALRVAATAGGVCNAVAFWFELQLDETLRLSTSPYAAKVCLFGMQIQPLHPSVHVGGFLLGLDVEHLVSLYVRVPAEHDLEAAFVGGKWTQSCWRDHAGALSGGV